MYSRLLSVVLCSVLATAQLTGCGRGFVTGLKPGGYGDKSKQTEATVVFRLAENQPEDYPTTLGDKEFARLVKERTNGRIQIEVYSGGLLGNEISVAEQLQYGAVDFARLSISSLSQIEKSMGTLMLPYVYRDKDHMFKVLEGPIGEKILENLENSAGIVGLCWLDAGTRNFYNSKKEIKSPDDMVGLRIRSQEIPLMEDFVGAVGALPVAMAYGDVYSALRTGVIDGAENNWPSFEAYRHYEVAKFITIDEHTRIPELILASKMVLNKISADDQEIIKEAAMEAALLQRSEWLRREEISRKKVESSGVKITTLQSNDAFKEKIKGLYNKHEKEYKAVINEIINTK
jgi:tripartite ATP-independent transporter DctP family solute receptor